VLANLLQDPQTLTRHSRLGRREETGMADGSSLRRIGGSATLVVALLIASTIAGAQCPIPANEFTPDPAFSSSFMLERCKFKTKGDNPFFPLRPGWRTRLESEEGVVVITVLHQTEVVDGVKTRVVEELEFERDGDELVPVERSLNFFEQTGSIHYFGEDVEFFDEEGNPIPGTGGWRAGQHGARAGVIMPGAALVGAAYYQEIAPEDSALDKGRIVAVHDGCEIGDFTFEQQCIEIVDTTDCDPTSEDRKVYVAGVGNVADEDLEVTSFGLVKPSDERDGGFE
jgi:hypothetical protein